jgi:hypothetical protein
MEPHDDPEARIRDLERPLSEVARTSELGVGAEGGSYGYVPSPSGAYPSPPSGAYPSPPLPPSTTPWDKQYPPMSPMPSTGQSRAFVIPVVIAVLAFVMAGGVSLYLFTMSSTSGPGNQVSGGGATLSDSPADRSSTGGGKTLPPTQRSAPNAPSVASEPTPPGATVSVAGIGENKTIACDGTILSISGIENTVTVTGECASLSVSGVDNTVTVDFAGSIVVSGFDNRIVYLAGEPETSSSGNGNTIERG